jgi:hypothetical protein
LFFLASTLVGFGFGDNVVALGRFTAC